MADWQIGRSRWCVSPQSPPKNRKREVSSFLSAASCMSKSIYYPNRKKMKTPKKTPAASASTSVKAKKNVNRSPIKTKAPAAASGGFIESLETAVTDIVISVFFQHDHTKGAFIKPHIDAWRSSSNGEDNVSKWYIDGIMPRRDGESNEPMKSIPGMPYHWFSIVTLRGSPQETPTEIGKQLAASFSAFSAPEFESKTFQFMGDSSSTPPLSLNNYLLDRDCIMYLKKIYFGVSKEEIMQDDETLAEFFGSPKEGKRVLSGVSDAEWERKMWYD